MSKGSDVYSKVFTFNTFHSETTQESLIWERISNLSGTIQELKRGAYCTSDSSVCCPVNAKITEFDGVGQRSIELGKECKLRDARQNVMDAINNITALKQEAAACSAAIGQLNSAEGLKASCNDASLAAEVSGLEGKVKSGDYSITAAAAQAIYANTCKGAPAVTTGGTAGTGTEATSATAATGAAATGTGSAPAGTGSTSTTGAAGTASSGSGCPVGFLLLAAAAFAFATREE